MMTWNSRIQQSNFVSLAAAFAILMAVGWTAMRVIDRGVQIRRDQAFVGAAATGDTIQMTMLLDQGEPVNSTSFDNSSGLWSAASNGRLPAVRLLLLRGANTEAPSQFGQTPLEAAVDRLGNDTGTADGLADAAIIKMLIRRGASVTKAKQNADSLRLLKSYGVKI